MSVGGGGKTPALPGTPAWRRPHSRHRFLPPFRPAWHLPAKSPRSSPAPPPSVPLRRHEAGSRTPTGIALTKSPLVWDSRISTNAPRAARSPGSPRKSGSQNRPRAPGSARSASRSSTSGVEDRTLARYPCRQRCAAMVVTAGGHDRTCRQSGQRSDTAADRTDRSPTWVNLGHPRPVQVGGREHLLRRPAGAAAGQTGHATKSGVGIRCRGTTRTMRGGEP